MSREAWPYNPKTLPSFLEACLVRFHLDACHSFTPYVEPALKKRCSHPFPGGHSGVVPPDPIPNSEVKRACADGSVALPCKSRSPPGALYLKTLTGLGGGFVFGAVPLAQSARAATGLRQGPHTSKPSPETVGIFGALPRRTQKANCNTSPPGLTELIPHRERCFFLGL